MKWVGLETPKCVTVRQRVKVLACYGTLMRNGSSCLILGIQPHRLGIIVGEGVGYHTSQCFGVFCCGWRECQV